MENNIVTYAPVVIPTLCRFEHFKRCVDSLSRCIHANQTELIIGLDYPHKESHVEGHSKILDYLNNGITGFKKVTIIKQSKNIGALLNYYQLLNYAFNFYDGIIVSEDDNEFSPNFLDYINRGLVRYNEVDEVVAICGYNYPVEMMDYSQKAYLSHNFSAWGCGIWKSKNEKYQAEYTPENSRKILRSPIAMLKILAKKPTLAISLWYMVRHKIILEDVNRELYNIIGNHYCLFPRLSLVRNWGHDGSGLNCGDCDNDIYQKQPIDANHEFDLNDEISVITPQFNKRLRKFFGDRPHDLILRTCRFIKRKIFS